MKGVIGERIEGTRPSHDDVVRLQALRELEVQKKEKLYDLTRDISGVVPDSVRPQEYPISPQGGLA